MKWDLIGRGRTQRRWQYRENYNIPSKSKLEEN